MTTDPAETAAAAAAGAAAAVETVSDEQAESERLAGMESATEVATGAAEIAGESAEVAAETSGLAVEAATEAVQAATEAGSEATTAVAEATEARSEVAELRDTLSGQIATMQALIEARLPERTGPVTEPEEVTVGTHGQDKATEPGTDGGSQTSAESGNGPGDIRRGLRRRHR